MERKNEIMPLFKYYFDTFSQKKFEKLIKVDPSIEDLLTKHNWPGNIFEVMNLAQNLINNMIFLLTLMLLLKRQENSNPFLNIKRLLNCKFLLQF